MVKYMNETLKQIQQFHGHLGPYAVIGFRMGKIANEKLGSDPFSKKVVVWTGTKPPLSCILDGIQMSSGCTTGKGNLTVKDEGVPKAHFSTNDGRHFKIKLKNLIQNEIDTTVTEENIIDYSKRIFEKSDNELFDF